MIKRLFETFVLPILEYASQIWSPKFKNSVKKIESIQKQFLIYALRKFHWHNHDDTNIYRLPQYEHRLLFFHMNRLEDRRLISQILFIFSLIHGKISSTLLLNELNFRMRFTRNELLLDEYLHANDSPFSAIKKQFNIINLIRNNDESFLVDFNFSIDTLKRKLKNYYELKINNRIIAI